MKKYIRYYVSALLGVLFLVECSAQEIQKPQISTKTDTVAVDYVVTPATTPPRIDGVLNDAVWKEATFNNDFRYFSQRWYLKQVKSKPGTSFAISADQNSLYIAMRCLEPNLDKMVKVVTRRDGESFSDDSIEVFIDPDRSGDHYYQISLSVAGGLFDMVGIDSGNRKRNDFNVKGITTATKINEKDWTAELAIPFAGLGVKPDNDGIWHLNVCRNIRTVEFQFSSSSWGALEKGPRWKGFHDAKIFNNVGGIPKPDYTKSASKSVQLLRRKWKLDVKPGPKVFSMEPIHDVTYVANNLTVPNWFTTPVLKSDVSKKNTRFFLELPEGVNLVAAGTIANTGDGLTKFSAQVYDVEIEKEIKRDGKLFTRYEVSVKTFYHKSRVIGPFYFTTKLEDGTRLPYYFQSVYDGNTQELQKSEILVKTFPTPGMPKKLLSLIHWIHPTAYMAWPDMLDSYTRLGFNSIPYNRGMVDALYPSAKTFLDQARETGMSVTAMHSAFHHLYWSENKEVRSLYKDKEATQNEVCPAYRGPLFWKEVEDIATWAKILDSKVLMLDVECYGEGAFSGWNQLCTRCNDYIKNSGLSPREAIISLGSQIHRITKKAVNEAFIKDGKVPPLLSWYNAAPGGFIYTDCFRFDDTYKNGDDFSTPSLYKSMKALVSGEKIRKYRALMDEGNIFPHATMGFLDAAGMETEYPTEWVHDQVLEIYGSGARGIGWFAFQKMEGSDLFHYAKAMEAINPVAELIYDSAPLKVDTSQGYSAHVLQGTTPATRNQYLILVSEYDEGKSGKVTVTFPMAVSGRLMDLSHKKDLGEVSGKSVDIDFKPGVEGAFTSLYRIK